LETNKASRTAGEGIPLSDIPLYQTAWVARTDLGLVNPSNIAAESYNPVDNFTVAQKSNDPLAKFFLSEFTADSYFNTTTDTVGYILFDDSEADLTSNPLALNPIYRSPDISTTFANIATSMTINMRNNADGIATVAGTATITKIVAIVHWEWISLPLFVILCACVLLVSAMWQTRRKRIPT
jgi:hypothetical protein